VANFVLNFSHFRYHSNRGRSDVNFNDIGKFLDTAAGQPGLSA